MIYLVCASEAHSAVCVWFRCGPQSDNEGVVLQIVDNGTVTDQLGVACGWVLELRSRKCVYVCAFG